MAVNEIRYPLEPSEPSVEERPRRRLSDILQTIASDESRERISIGDIFEVLGDRAFGALMLIFALPNIVPSPPGTSAITGTPLVFLAAQLMLGRSPWLPRIIADRSMRRADFSAIITRIAPWFARTERMLKPRMGYFVYPPAEHVIGFVCFVLAVILALPIPLGNILPAIAICLFSFALLERDGLFALLGLLLSAVSLLVVSGVIYALVKAAIFLLTTMVF